MENIIFKSSTRVVCREEGSSPIIGRPVIVATSSSVGLIILKGKRNPFKGVDQKPANTKSKSRRMGMHGLKA